MAKIAISNTTPGTDPVDMPRANRTQTTQQTTDPAQAPTVPAQADPDGAKPPATAGGDNTGLWAGFPNENVPNGQAHGWWRKHGGELPNFDIPILTRTNHETNRDIDYNREPATDRDDDERYWQNRANSSSRANLRRDIIRDYLDQNLRSTVYENRGQFSDRNSLQQFGRTVAETLSRVFNDPEMLTDRTIRMVTNEVSHLLSSREFDVRSQTIPFDRANQIANLVLQNIRTQIEPNIRSSVDSRKILDGLILLQLCANPGRHMGDMRTIMGHKPCILPDGMPWSVFRNTGLLAANLLKDGAAMRTATDMDAAVRRFVKLLVVNNELGILLAAARLSADARMGMVSPSRVLALVQIYQLIAQLLVTAEQAMKEAAATQRPAELVKTDRGLAFSEASSADDAEFALRRYLEFNPGARADTCASAFFTEELGENAARLAVDASQQAMEDWLRSGRHRFVYDVDLGEPLGIVLDKTSDECFVASTIRVVLLRDSSALGWRMFRSFLVG